MKKTLFTTLIFLVLTMILAGCGKTDSTAGKKADTSAKSETPVKKTRKLIIDTDTGADDAAALILAARHEEADILGVTVLAGNVDLEQGTKNALMALEIAGSDAPVFKGADTPYNGVKKTTFSVFGEDGMGEADLIHPKGKAQDQNAVDFILETVKANPGEVEIVVLGPATNIALAIDKDPETMRQVKHIWSMGTTGLGPGNATPVAEFNVVADAPAYAKMLETGMPITIIGFDICGGKAMWTGKQFEKLKKTNKIGAFVADSFGEVRKFYQDNGEGDRVNVCDGLAMTCVLDEDFIQKTTDCHAVCLTQEGDAYGQVIFYRKGFTYDMTDNEYKYQGKLVIKVKQKEYFDRYLKAIQ